MAAFLVRAFDLPQAGDAGFSDTAANTHHDAINALAALGMLGDWRLTSKLRLL